MPFLVLWPVARAVPAAAESVTGDEAEYVVMAEATGSMVMVILSGPPFMARLKAIVDERTPKPMPSPMK